MAKLSKRDRNALFLLSAALLLLFLYAIVLSPLLNKRNRLERGIRIKEVGLVEMRQVQTNISQLSQQNNTLGQRVAQRPETFGLFAFLEQKGAESRVKENILYMKPSDPVGEGELQQVMVEMKLQGVTLGQLVSFLELIEAPKNIVELERISIVVNKKDMGSLDAVMRVVSLVLVEENGE